MTKRTNIIQFDVQAVSFDVETINIIINFDLFAVATFLLALIKNGRGVGSLSADCYSQKQ